MIKSHRAELIAAVLGISISVLSAFVFISPEIAWLSGILTAFIALSAAIVKEFIGQEVHRLSKETSSLSTRANRIVDILSNTGDDRYSYALDEVDNCIQKLSEIESGRIPLSESDYYLKIIEKMDMSNNGDEILAVSSFDEIRWTDHLWQRNYIAANEAAAKRGAVIRRIFIVDKSNLEDESYRRGFQKICEQINSDNIDACVVYKENVPTGQNLVQDWVLFSVNPSKDEIYHAVPEETWTTRVQKAELIMLPTMINSTTENSYRQNFKKLIVHSSHKDDFLSEVYADHEQ